MEAHEDPELEMHKFDTNNLQTSHLEISLRQDNMSNHELDVEDMINDNGLELGDGNLLDLNLALLSICDGFFLVFQLFALIFK